VDDLRFDAGSLSLNLVATVGRRFANPVERLDSPERLREWLSGVGLAGADADLERLRRLREHLDTLFRAALAGGPAPANSVSAVNAAGGPRLTSDLALAGPVEALVAADAIRILTGAERGDLRACAADDCRMLYLARGRRARRWCSSERCGNRSRVAAHRARAR
jgi:predicted RNA-binding Zn ribbon-like protein